MKRNSIFTKRHLFVAVAVLAVVFFCTPLRAQTDSLSWEQTMPRHDVHLSIGDPLLTTFNDAYSADNFVSRVFYSIFETFGWVSKDYTTTDWFTSDYVHINNLYTPNFNFGYEYRFKKWFWFGGTCTYGGSYDRWVDRVTKQTMLNSNFHYIGITPTFRFSWLNKTHVTLYSGFSIGLGCYFGTVSKGDTYLESVERSRDLHYFSFAGELNLIGVKAGGEHWYGFAELGVGTHGLVQAGFGYHFNPKKTK